MTLVKYQPNRRVVSNNFDRIFDDFFGKSFFNDTVERDFIPKTDIAETDQYFELSIALSGIDKNDISVEVEDSVLTVSGERKREEDKEGKTYKKIESHYGAFKRSFKLPENVNESDIKASYNNGVLVLELPKEEIVKKTNVIKVK